MKTFLFLSVVLTAAVNSYAQGAQPATTASTDAAQPQAVQETWYPAPTYKAGPDPYASPYAVPGGTLMYAGHTPPKSLNVYLDSNTFSAMVFQMMYQPLITRDSLTGEYAPMLAKRWSISADQTLFTFCMDPEARWSDGSPITAHDVKATFDAIMHPSNTTGSYKLMFSTFESPEVIDDYTVRFKALSKHWRNLSAFGGFFVMPKAMLDGKNFNHISFKFPIISGPYALDEIQEGISVTLKRQPNHWGFKTGSSKYCYNFDKIIVRFFQDTNNAYEAFRKGEVDVYAVYSARVWNNESTGSRFDKNWIVKQNVKNHNPIGFQGFVMNTRRPPYDDPRVRKALYYLFDRQRVVRTLMYNAYLLHNSYYQDLYSETDPCPNAQYTYAPEKAYALLKEAGYALNRETGKLEKDGKPLVVNMLSRSASDAVYLALYKEALQNIGIDFTITQKDFATWMKEMEEYNFDMTTAAWGAAIERDPEYMWSGAQRDVPAGNNLAGIADPEIDRLIEQQKTEYSINKRNAILRQIDKRLADAVPYILNWYTDSTRLLYWNKFGVPPTVLGRYGDAFAIPAYWWYDADSERELNDAMKNDTALPGYPAVVDFDDVVKE